MAQSTGTSSKDFGRKGNWNIRESVDNLDLNDDFAPPVEKTIDPNATIGIGNMTIGGGAQVIGGGGVNDMTMDPNSTVGDLLGEMSKPKNYQAATVQKPPQPKPVPRSPINDAAPVSIYE